jgi:hypothetical protein
MSFTPVLPLKGYSGWMFLKRTQAQQEAAFRNQPSLQRDAAYLRERIGKIRNAEALVADTRLLRISLTAFGLEGDIQNRFFIRKVLEEGTLRDGALANRLADKRYREFSAAFGFGDLSPPRNVGSDFPEKLLNRYLAARFQAEVGNQNTDYRLALNAQGELARLAQTTASERTKWFSVLGSPPLRQVFEKAFGLPSAFAALDLDKQVETLERRSRATFGEPTITQFSDPGNRDKLLRLFLVRSESLTLGLGSSQAQNALTLLQQSRPLRF